MFRESSYRIFGYLSGLLIVIFGAVHLATHSFLGVEGYSDSLRYISVIGRYRNPIFAFTLEMLLLTVTYHSLTGIRAVLLEYRQGEKWGKIITSAILISGVGLIFFGTIIVFKNYLL